MSLTDDRTVEQPLVAVPDGVEYVEPEVRELARGIAADIRKYGHYQSKPGQRFWDDEGGECCIIVNPTTIGLGFKASSLKRLKALLPAPDPRCISDWSDSTPTADVLATLDRIAEGLVAR